MARWQYIPERAYRSPALLRLSLAHRAIYLGLWTACDRWGRGDADEYALRQALGIFDGSDIETLLRDLATAKLVDIWETREGRFWGLPEYGSDGPHDVRRNRTESRFPAPPDATSPDVSGLVATNPDVSGPDVAGAGALAPAHAERSSPRARRSAPWGAPPPAPGPEEAPGLAARPEPASSPPEMDPEERAVASATLRVLKEPDSPAKLAQLEKLGERSVYAAEKAAELRVALDLAEAEQAAQAEAMARKKAEMRAQLEAMAAREAIGGAA